MLEHVNIRVPSLARTQAFLGAAFPDFRVRGSGFSPHYGYWSHFGNDDHYVALFQGEEPGRETDERVAPFSGDESYRLMHVAYVVEDVESLMTRLGENGFEPDSSSNLDSHPFRRRVYYLDGNGIEWEFIHYLSDKPEERNDYKLEEKIG